MFVFINALIVNPSFDSQTKEMLTTRHTKFGPDKYKPKIEDAFLKKVIKSSGIIDEVLHYAKAKQNRALAKKMGGKKTSKLLGIPKLDDANNAGGRKSTGCTLILTEGDSAKSLAIAGLSVIGRDNYGVFPLKGKFYNSIFLLTPSCATMYTNVFSFSFLLLKNHCHPFLFINFSIICHFFGQITSITPRFLFNQPLFFWQVNY